MARSEFERLVQAYGAAGIRAWGQQPAALKRGPSQALGNKIADNEGDVTRTLNKLQKRNGIPDLFIPMPATNRDGVKWSFFLPVNTNGQGVAFDLLLVLDGGNCLGFRFEPPDPDTDHHCYGHVQLCRKMCGASIEVKGIPAWLPPSYPAFPIGVSEETDVFLAMVLSMHGCPNRTLQVIDDMFASDASTRRNYQQRVTKLLARVAAA